MATVRGDKSTWSALRQDKSTWSARGRRGRSRSLPEGKEGCVVSEAMKNDSEESYFFPSGILRSPTTREGSSTPVIAGA